MAQRKNVKMSIEDLLSELKKYQARLPKLQRKERKLQKQLAAVQAEIESLGGVVGSLAGKKPGRIAKGAKAKGRRPVKRAKNKVKLADAIVAVLSSDKSLSVPQIAEAVKSQGYTSKSKTFQTIIYQTLGRDKRVKRVARGQYRLKT